jgi:hypothetical protein
MSDLPDIIGLWSPAAGCGKSTVAGILFNRAGYHVEPFARTLKRMLQTMLVDAGMHTGEAIRMIWHDKHEPITCLPGAPTSRRLQQTLGTEWGRDLIGPDLWVEIWTRRAMSHAAGVVADDVRMANEAAAVRALGGEVWQVLRPGVPGGDQHRTEAGLGDGFVFNRTIINDGTIDELRAQVLGCGRPTAKTEGRP